MALILNIETATRVCSVALGGDGKLLAARNNNEGQSHARVLTTLITECLSESGYKLEELDAISVSKGPGSFTGLRIGVASAKGLCYALDKPLLSINTLQSMASWFREKNPDFVDALLCPLIDARRLEVYTAVFKNDLAFARETSAVILKSDSFDNFLNENRVVFFGDAIDKTAAILGDRLNAVFIRDFEPSASGMIGLSERLFTDRQLEDATLFEPFYLKDFYTPGQPPR